MERDRSSHDISTVLDASYLGGPRRLREELPQLWSLDQQPRPLAVFLQQLDDRSVTCEMLHGIKGEILYYRPAR